MRIHGRVMGKYVAPICLYPFAATLVQLQALDPTITELLAVSGADSQTLTYAMHASPASAVKSAQTTNLAAPQTIDCTTGAHAVEWAITAPSLPASGLTMLLQLLTLDLSHSVVLTLNARNNAGSPVFDAIFYVDGVSRYAATDLVSAPTKAAVRIDSAAGGSVELYLDGSATPVTLSSASVTPAAYGVVAEAQQASGSSGADAGKTMVVTLHSNHSSITTPMPNGTLDACGNLIS